MHFRILGSLLLYKLFKKSWISSYSKRWYYMVSSKLISTIARAILMILGKLENIFLLHLLILRERKQSSGVFFLCYHGDLQFWVRVFLGEEIPGRLRISLWVRYTHDSIILILFFHDPRLLFFISYLRIHSFLTQVNHIYQKANRYTRKETNCWLSFQCLETIISVYNGGCDFMSAYSFFTCTSF